MVSEVLNEALHNKEIILVQLEWVKFITHWSRSSPGWYCGIMIKKRGQWANELMRCRCTI